MSILQTGHEKYLVPLNDQFQRAYATRAGIHVAQLRVASDDLCYFAKASEMFRVC